MKGRKGQEEALGFVAVVVVVVIAGVVILGFMLNNDNSNISKESRELFRFIESSNSFTTECVIGYEPRFQTIVELTKECYKDEGSLCLDGRNTCKVLNDSLSGLLSASFGGESILAGYIYSTDFVTNRTGEIEKENIVKIQNGNCSADFSSYIYPVAYSGGNIEITIKTC
jgi:hypothetical protein